MQSIMLVLLLSGAAPSSWCSDKNWNRRPSQCLEKADLVDAYQDWYGMVRGISEQLKISVPGIRVGGLHDATNGRMEVWHVGDGVYEIRAEPESLRDSSDDTLLAMSAHEVCHIIHGDAGYGTWDSMSDKKKKERQQSAWACAFAIVGREVLAVYLREVDKPLTPEQITERLRIMAHDAQWWLDWRQKTQRVVPN